MENVKVYSPVEDNEIRKDLNNSPIWKKAYHEEEFMANPKRYPTWFVYSFKFDGLKPQQVTNIQKVTK